MLIGVFVFGAAWLVPGADPKPAPSQPPAAIENDIPIGRLGFKVGTFLTIEGLRAEKGKVGANTLLVDAVNGERLARPVPLWIDNVDGLPRQTRCVLRGYESARMIGIPFEVAQKENLPMPQAAWQLFRYFIVTSVVEPKGLKLTGASFAKRK